MRKRLTCRNDVHSARDCRIAVFCKDVYDLLAHDRKPTSFRNLSICPIHHILEACRDPTALTIQHTPSKQAHRHLQADLCLPIVRVLPENACEALRLEGQLGLVLGDSGRRKCRVREAPALLEPRRRLEVHEQVTEATPIEVPVPAQEPR